MDGAVGFTRVVETKGGRAFEECGRYEGQKFLSTLNEIIESYRGGKEKHGGKNGVPFSVVANDVWDDPACVSTWKDGRTEEARAMRRAWDALCSRIARDFGQLYPDVSMWVELYPASLEGEEEEQPPPYPSRIPRETRKGIVREEYREIVARIEGLEARGMAREEAKNRVREDLGCGRTKIRDALAFVAVEREAC